jgi:hypothetical protein
MGSFPFRAFPSLQSRNVFRHPQPSCRQQPCCLQLPDTSACCANRVWHNRCLMSFPCRTARPPDSKAWLLTASPSASFVCTRHSLDARCSPGVTPLQGFSRSRPGTRVSACPPSMGFSPSVSPALTEASSEATDAAALRSIIQSRSGQRAHARWQPS